MCNCNECIRMREDLDSANECNIVLYSEVERLKQKNDQLSNDIINANMNSELAIDLSIELKEEVERLKQENQRLLNKNNNLIKELGSKVILDYEKGV